MTDWPTRLAHIDDKGWVLDEEGNYLRIPNHKNEALGTDASGWMYGAAPKPEKPEPEKPKSWDWPEAWDEPDPSSWNYEARHPTRYTWRDDVEAWARYLVDNYDVWCNTYYDHPEGYWRTEDSIDVWGPQGRNDPIDPALGDEIFNLLFKDPGKPDIDWIIWRRYIYGAWNGWNGEFFGDGSAFTNHEDHVHVSFK